MIKVISLIALLLTLSSCILNTPHPVVSNEKTFELEDMYIVFALRAEQLHDYKTASSFFNILYQKSKKKEYFYRSIQNDLLAKKYNNVIQRVDTLSEDTVFDVTLARFKVIALFEQNRLDEAIKLSVVLAAKTKIPNDYLLTSDIYTKRKEFDLAVRYLESAYEKEHNEKILDKMSIILYVNLDKKKEAIAYLETHSRMMGCSELICHRLAAFYSNDNNVEGLLSTYLRLYKYKKDENIAKKIIQTYTYKGDYLSLISFLEESGSDDEVLLQLYVFLKKYEKAYKLADKLYEDSGDINYLGQSAIYEYEVNGVHTIQKVVQKVIEKLKHVVAMKKDAKYLNYLGYIMIEHDIDVEDGLHFVDEALVIKPKSAYYLDSRAWGYYKLGQCKKAKQIITKVLTLEGGDDPEVLGHKKIIDRCVKIQKGEKRK